MSTVENSLSLAARLPDAAEAAATLLPPNATALERATLTAEIVALARKRPEVIAEIWDPELCPAPMLPFLAWALSVDVWDRTWSEARQRSAIAAAPAVHRRKGTVFAVRRALEALGLTVTVTEWWQDSDIPRGHFRVEAITYDPAIDGARADRQAFQAMVGQAARLSKPKSRPMDLRAAFGLRHNVYLAAHVRKRGHTRLRLIAEAPPRLYYDIAPTVLLRRSRGTRVAITEETAA